jgi:hypothetical protein
MAKEIVYVNVKCCTWTEEVVVMIPPRLWAHKNIAKCIEAAVRETFEYEKEQDDEKEAK